MITIIWLIILAVFYLLVGFILTVLGITGEPAKWSSIWLWPFVLFGNKSG